MEEDVGALVAVVGAHPPRGGGPLRRGGSTPISDSSKKWMFILNQETQYQYKYSQNPPNFVLKWQQE